PTCGPSHLGGVSSISSRTSMASHIAFTSPRLNSPSELARTREGSRAFARLVRSKIHLLSRIERAEALRLRVEPHLDLAAIARFFEPHFCDVDGTFVPLRVALNDDAVVRLVEPVR